MTDHSISEKIEYKYLSFINKVFLVVHIGFLLLFANLKINFMVYFNLGSILFTHWLFYAAKIQNTFVCLPRFHWNSPTYVGCDTLRGAWLQFSVMSVRRDFVFLYYRMYPSGQEEIHNTRVDSEQSLLRCHRCLIRGGKPDFTFLSPFPDGNRYPGSRNRNFCTPAYHYFHAFLTPVYGSWGRKTY